MTRWIFLINKALNVLFVFLLFLLYNSTQDNQEIVICRRRRCELGLNVSVKKNNYQLNWKILLFLFCLFVSFFFFSFNCEQGVRLLQVNQRGRRAHGWYACRCVKRRTRLHTQNGGGEKGQECPTLTLRVPDKMIVCVRDTTAAK